jgi:hypothetical protein
MKEITNADEKAQIEATVDVADVLFALKMNATHGADDRVIAVPQRDGSEAKIRNAFRGSERYSNPESAPVHIKPEGLVEDGFKQPPERHQVREFVRDEFDAPANVDEWDDDLMAEYDNAHEQQMEVWETDVRGMIEAEHEFEGKGNKITLIGVSDE